MTFEQLADAEAFTRSDFYNAYKEKYGSKSNNALDYALRKEMAEGRITHVGRNQFSYAESRRIYKHNYSPEAQKTASEIMEEYPEVDFQIFELTQLNAFVNHLIAHNTIFISVENEVMDYVFDTLRGVYPGRIMLKPKADEYFRYLVDDQLVITRLPSETPKGVDEPWKSRLEKILVDITVDKLISQIVSEGEYQTIFTQAFERYLLDMGGMLRYANRRGAGGKFKKVLEEYKPTQGEA